MLKYKDFENYELNMIIVSEYSSKTHINKSLKMIANATSGIKYLVNHLHCNKADYFLNMKDAIDFYNKY